VRLSHDPSTQRIPGTIVVGFSRHASSGSALAAAAQLGIRMNTSLVVVHAVEVEDYPIDPDSWNFEEEGERTITEHKETVSSLLANTGCRWTFQVVRGDPVDALIRVARDVDALMIVVGSRAFKHRVLRSRIHPVAGEVIDRGEYPVLVIKAKDPDQAP
jgi:nucleotide-binding universal stress UspA family protein